MFTFMSIFYKMAYILSKFILKMKIEAGKNQKEFSFICPSAIYDIGFSAGIKLGYSLHWPGTC